MASGTLALAGTVNLPRSSDKAYVLDWICTAGGVVDQSITDLIGEVGGGVIALETVPGLNGDLATQLPDNLYDVTIDDAYATDIAAGALANRSGTVGERINPAVAIPIWGALTLKIAAAGVTEAGRIIIVISDN